MSHQEHRPSQSHDPLVRGPAAQRPTVAAATSTAASRSIGFRTSPHSPATGSVLAERATESSASTRHRVEPASSTPTPLPKRPKGNHFLGVAFLTVLFIATWTVWNAYFRYNAYGTISGRVIEIPASHAGIVRSIHVRQGEVVFPGQLLATMQDLDAKAELDRLHDELAMAQATLDAEMTKLSWESRLREDQTQRTLADYYKSWGTLLMEEAELSNMEVQLRRKEGIVRTVPRVITEEEFETLRFAIQGQRAKVDKLKSAVENLRKLVGILGPEEGPQQLKPHLSRIKSLQADISRARERLELLELRSSVHGRVIRTHFFAGEYVPAESPVLDILEDGSVEAVLYLPQRRAQAYAKGDIIELHVVPNAETLPAEITGFGEQMVAPPLTLQRYYRSNETLLQVHARPCIDDDEQHVNVPLRLGSEIRLTNVAVKRSELPRANPQTDRRHITRTEADTVPEPAERQDEPAVHHESTGPSSLKPIQRTSYETVIPRTSPRLRSPAAGGPRSRQARRLPPCPCL